MRRQIRLAPAPPDVGVAAEGAEAGARRVDEHAVERGAERGGAGGVRLDDAHARGARAAHGLGEQPDPARRTSVATMKPVVAHRRRHRGRLAARRRAGVEHALARAGAGHQRARAATLRPGRRTRRSRRAASAADCRRSTIRPSGAKRRRLGARTPCVASVVGQRSRRRPQRLARSVSARGVLSNRPTPPRRRIRSEPATARPATAGATRSSTDSRGRRVRSTMPGRAAAAAATGRVRGSRAGGRR